MSARDRGLQGLSVSGNSRGRRRTAAVIGGAGFLGSHLTSRLLGEGYRVYCLDNFHTGRRRNVSHLLATGWLEVIEHDILDPIPAELPRFDEIYNLGCPASPPHYQADPVNTALVCAQGTLNCLRRAEVDQARLMHASTSEIYGDPEVHPQSEDYHGNVNTVGPRSCYDEGLASHPKVFGKRYAETLITDFGRRYGVTTRIARIFNTYGPRMQRDDGRRRERSDGERSRPARTILAAPQRFLDLSLCSAAWLDALGPALASAEAARERRGDSFVHGVSAATTSAS